MARGWRLTAAAWQVMRRDRTMILLAIFGAGCGIAGAGAVFYFGGYFSSTTHSRGHFALVALIALYPLTLISVFFNVALASAAQANFEGRRLSLGEALATAWGRLGKIALWSLLSAGVGLILSEISARIPGGGKLASWLLGAAWSVGTIFAVPLLALEDAGPIEALRGSAHLIKSKWGEGISGLVGIGAWTVIVAMPAGVLLAIGLVSSGRHPGSGIPMIVLGVTALVVVSALSTATRQVFAVALYRYAVDTPTGGFPAVDLEYPFAPKVKGRRRTHWLAYAVLGLLVVLIVLGAVLGNRSEPLTDARGHAHVYFAATPENVREIQVGMPVKYDGGKIGHVLLHRIEGTEEYVRYYVDPRFRGLPESSFGIELNDMRPAHPYLRIFDSSTD